MSLTFTLGIQTPLQLGYESGCVSGGTQDKAIVETGINDDYKN
jgi:hypothetical protein